MSRPSDWRLVPLAPRLRVAPNSGRRGVRLPALTGTTDWRRRVADRAGAAVVAMVGASVLPTAPHVDWPEAGLTTLGDALHDALPTLGLIGAVLPRQHGRTRLSLLGRMAGNAVVIKVGAAGEGIEHEAEVLRRLAIHPIPGVATPEPLAHGHLVLPSRRSSSAASDAETLAYLVTFAIDGRQRPATDATLHTFEADLGRRLRDMPKPPGTPDHFVPVHGDVAPYNLRRTSRGLALFDWEDARWGPPGSDLELYRRRCRLLAAGAPIPPPSEMLEAL